MTFHRLGLVNKNQMGFTLGELMLALVISGVITGGVTMTMFQVFEGNIRTSNHMTAVRQVQNAGYWVSHDAQMAQTVVLGVPAGSLFTLSWVGWEYPSGSNTGIDTYEVWYTYVGASDKIRRDQKITTNKYDDDGQLLPGYPTVSESLSFIAEHITTTPTVTLAGNKLSVTITASFGEAEDERTYEIRPRAKP
jgi:type II secretory pathway pseudopilin PulG